jgi:neuralized-like protein 4
MFIDYGQLIAADGITISDESKDEKSDNAELIFSPVLEYAAEFSPTHPYVNLLRNYYFYKYHLFDLFCFYRFIDSRTRRRLNAKVAFQILVQPGSYKVGSPTHEVPTDFAGRDFDLDNIQWSTKEQRNIHVSALLVKLDGYLFQ